MCIRGGSYKVPPLDEAITFVWDESRQPTVATPFIMGPITEGLLNGFSTRMSVIVYSRNLARFSSHTRTPAAFIVL